MMIDALTTRVVRAEEEMAQAGMQATPASPVSRGRLWTGRIISALVVLFLLFDGITEAMKVKAVLDASAQLGYPVTTIAGIGITLLVCTALYLIPQTAVLGAVLLTGYLGGAVASSVRISGPLFNILFPIIFAAVMWAGLFLREERLRALMPLRT
jgi:DoxX-like protein